MAYNPLNRRQFVLGATAAASTAQAVGTGRLSIQNTGRSMSQKPAILGGDPIRTTPFASWPVIDKTDEAYFLDSLKAKKWCRLDGLTVTQFEEKWAALLGAGHSIGVVNGTSALYAALNALDVGPGDEVLVPAYTFVATINAVIQQFALPVFVDTDIETQEMDPEDLERRITDSTRCIIPVHLGGNVADMDRIRTVASRHGIPVVEDACQAHFAEWKGKRAGNLGDIGCFSFQASKILPCGEGGAVVTSREDLYDRLHAFQNNGRDRVSGSRNGYLHQGTNLRMTEYQAALLLAQLTRFEGQCKLRDENAAYLTSLLEQIPGIEPARRYDGCSRNTYYIFMARYRKEGFSGLPRGKFLQALRKEGIPCGAGYKPVNKEPFLEKTLNSRSYKRLFSRERLDQYWAANECPATDRLSEEGLFFSQTCLLGTRSDIEQIGEAVARIQAHSGEIATS
jgi:dTDP-4-amino-4,6-dideoxygalactose transaminase